MLAHALDVVSYVLVRGSSALRFALTKLLHHSEMGLLGHRLERSPSLRAPRIEVGAAAAQWLHTVVVERSIRSQFVPDVPRAAAGRSM